MVPSRVYDAIVIGGGIVGASTAYHLNMFGAKTMLVDRADRGRATDAGAGILAPEMSLHAQERWFDFAVEAVAYYPRFIARLNRQQGGETSYAVCGMLLVATDEEEAEEFEKARTLILARQARRGTPTAQDLHAVTPAEAKELFPALGDVRHALYYRNAARVDGHQLTQALCTAGAQAGLTILHANVERLTMEGERLTGIVADGVTYSTGTTIIAGGAWSPALGEQLGIQIPVQPQRGQIVHLELPGVDTTQWPIVSDLRGHYMLTWPQNRVVVGATRESDSGFDTYTSVGGVIEVLEEALRVAPSLRSARLGEVRVGLRPATADGLPVLGDVPGITRLHLATGHGPTGLQLGPFTGHVIAEIALGAPNVIDISAFNISRFMN